VVGNPLDEGDAGFEMEGGGEGAEVGELGAAADDVELDGVVGAGEGAEDEVGALVLDEAAVVVEAEVYAGVGDAGDFGEAAEDAAVDGVDELGVAAAGHAEGVVGALATGYKEGVGAAFAGGAELVEELHERVHPAADFVG